MKRIVLFVVFACFGISSVALANEADKKACENPPSNGVWHGLAQDGSKCECKEGYFNNRKIPVKGGWRKLMDALAEKGEKNGISTVITDVCTQMDAVKAAAKKNKITVVADGGNTAPTKFSGRLTPGDANEVKGGATLRQKLLVTNGGNQVAKFIATCSACNINNENPLIVVKPLIPESGYIFDLTQANPEVAATANFVVTVIGKNGSELGTYNASVGWTAKSVPPPVVTLAPQSDCVKAPSNGLDLAGGHCSCIGKKEVQKGTAWVCEELAPPAPAKVEKTGSIHLRLDSFAGYARSEIYTTPVYGLALGVGWQFVNDLGGYVEAGFQLPGASKTDQYNRPVVVNGQTDDRSLSWMGEAGLEFAAHKYILLGTGARVEMLGVHGGTNPVFTTISGVVRVKGVVYQAPDVRLSVGPSGVIGVQSHNGGHSWYGFLINFTAEFFGF